MKYLKSFNINESSDYKYSLTQCREYFNVINKIIPKLSEEILSKNDDIDIRRVLLKVPYKIGDNYHLLSLKLNGENSKYFTPEYLHKFLNNISTDIQSPGVKLLFNVISKTLKSNDKFINLTIKKRLNNKLGRFSLEYDLGKLLNKLDNNFRKINESSTQKYLNSIILPSFNIMKKHINDIKEISNNSHINIIEFSALNDNSFIFRVKDDKLDNNYISKIINKEIKNINIVKLYFSVSVKLRDLSYKKNINLSKIISEYKINYISELLLLDYIKSKNNKYENNIKKYIFDIIKYIKDKGYQITTIFDDTMTIFDNDDNLEDEIFELNLEIKFDLSNYIYKLNNLYKNINGINK